MPVCSYQCKWKMIRTAYANVRFLSFTPYSYSVIVTLMLICVNFYHVNFVASI